MIALIGMLTLISFISPNLYGYPERGDVFLEPLVSAGGNISYSLTGVHDIKEIYNTRIIGEDFPPPETPVTAIILPRGKSTEIF